MGETLDLCLSDYIGQRYCAPSTFSHLDLILKLIGICITCRNSIQI